MKKTDDVMEKEILKTKITAKTQRPKKKHGKRIHIHRETQSRSDVSPPVLLCDMCAS